MSSDKNNDNLSEEQKSGQSNNQAKKGSLKNRLFASGDGIIDSTKKSLEILILLISTSYTASSIIFNYYNTLNKANFYGIPVYYFVADKITFSMSKPLIGLVTILLFAFPLLYKVIFKDKKISKYGAVLLSFAISLAIIYLNFESVFSFIYSSIPRAVLVVLFFAIIFPFILYRTFYSFEIIESDEKQDKISNLPLIQIAFAILLGVLISWVLYCNVFKTDKLDEGYMSIIKDKDGSNVVDVIVKNIGDEKAVLMNGEINDGELKLMKFNYWIDKISGRRIDYINFNKINPVKKNFEDSSDKNDSKSEEKVYPKEQNKKSTDDMNFKDNSYKDDRNPEEKVCPEELNNKNNYDNNSDMLSGYKNHVEESLEGKNVIIINNNFYEHNKDGLKDVKETDSYNHGEMRDEFRK